jgi:hypothetical protein
MKPASIPCLLLLLAAPAAATPLVKDAALTLYSQDLGLVRETRGLSLAAEGRFTLDAIAPRFDASSVRIVPRGGWRVTGWSTRVPERDWLALWRGKLVRVLEVGDRVVEGTLVHGDDGVIVVRGEDASTVIYRSQVKEVRSAQTLDIPPPEPTLELSAEGVSGRSEAELSYLTGGLSWQAEHLVVRTGEKAVEWSAAAVLSNACGADFQKARFQLIAGEPRRTRGPVVEKMMAMRAAPALEAAAEPMEQPFADYHLYTLDGAFDLRDGETRSVTLLAPRTVQVAPRYLYNGQQAGGVRAQLEVLDKKESGLGVPLAGGRVRFYQRDESGGLLFTGEDRLKHTAVDEKLTLEMGTAFDLVADRRVLQDRRVADRERESTVEIKLRNRKKTEATIVVEEPVGGDFEVIRKTHDFVKKDANTLQFTIPVPAGQEVRLEYTVRVRW